MTSWEMGALTVVLLGIALLGLVIFWASDDQKKHFHKKLKRDVPNWASIQEAGLYDPELTHKYYCYHCGRDVETPKYTAHDIKQAWAYVHGKQYQQYLTPLIAELEK
jgi:hypothetical protein